MKILNKYNFIIKSIIIALLTLSPSISFINAYTIEKLPDEAVYNDFVVGPGKSEMVLKPGESKTINLMVANRLGKTKTFEISAVDFVGTKDTNNVVTIVKGNDSPYSLKKYINFESNKFTLKHGEKVTIPVTINIPSDIAPGGMYGGVVVSAGSTNDAGTDSINTVVSQISSLIFVKVDGDVNHDLNLQKFTYENNEFQILYENNGSVHENPSGFIRIKNTVGSEVENIKLDPWYILPNSLRVREITINKPLSFGKYSASLEINKGYGEKIDNSEVTFWVVPVGFVASILATIVLIVAVAFLIIKKRRPVVMAILLFVGMAYSGHIVVAQVMGSGSYKIQSDSINFSGGRESSASYAMENTAGEIATGESSSNTYKMKAGFQQMNGSVLSMTSASDVSMSPSLGDVTGGTSNGSTNFTVTTDNSAGYSVSIESSTDPAMQSSSDSIDDYASTASNPGFTFSVLASESRFAYSPEGTDITDAFKDDGASCNTGSGDTADRCWAGLDTVAQTIVSRNSSNLPSGTETTLKFRAGIGSSRDQDPGTYTATTILTLMPL